MRRRWNRNPDYKELADVDQRLLPLVREILKEASEVQTVIEICLALEKRGAMVVKPETRLYRGAPQRIVVSDILGALNKAGEMEGLCARMDARLNAGAGRMGLR